MERVSWETARRQHQGSSAGPEVGSFGRAVGGCLEAEAPQPAESCRVEAAEARMGVHCMQHSQLLGSHPVQAVQAITPLHCRGVREGNPSEWATSARRIGLGGCRAKNSSSTCSCFGESSCGCQGCWCFRGRCRGLGSRCCRSTKESGVLETAGSANRFSTSALAEDRVQTDV